MNVSSIVVKTKPEYTDDVIHSINAVEFCEVHFNDSEGKIVATIEGNNINEQMDRLKTIQSLPFVFSANLAYSYCEDELTAALAQVSWDNPFVHRD